MIDSIDLPEQPWEKASELEQAYVELCKVNGVDPVGLHVDLQDWIENVSTPTIIPLGVMRVLLACVEVAGGF